MKKIVCDRCNGLGYIEQWRDSMHLDGMCFKCKGTKFIEIDEKKELKKQKISKQKNGDIVFLKEILEPIRKSCAACRERNDLSSCEECKRKNYCIKYDRLKGCEENYKTKREILKVFYNKNK